MTEATDVQQRPILALVTDLFFTLKIGDTAKALGLPIHFVSSAEELLDRFRQARPALVIADLTLKGVDMATLFEELAAGAPRSTVPILGYTTHADWKRTGPLHNACTRVVTKDTLAHSLGGLMQQLIQQG
jgi:CheY-like chemotaxis protein